MKNIPDNYTKMGYTHTNNTLIASNDKLPHQVFAYIMNNCDYNDPNFRIVYLNSCTGKLSTYRIDSFATKYGFLDSLLYSRVVKYTRKYEKLTHEFDYSFDGEKVSIYLPEKSLEVTYAVDIMIVASPPMLSIMKNRIIVYIDDEVTKYTMGEFAEKYNLMHIIRNQLILAALNC